MSIRPWVVVEAPDDRGLRRVTVDGETAGSAWSMRELRRILERLGHPDVDVTDPARVHWRGGDSDTWPDHPRRRHTAALLMMAGLLASAVLNAVIGWPDASGAMTFAQRLTGALFVLSAPVQAAAALAVIDHWGKRHSRVSGATVLLGVLTSTAADGLLLLLWFEEREYTPYLLVFMPLCCWSVWALWLLLKERSWKGVTHPRKFAAGVFVSALLTALSLVYSTMYEPTVAPMSLALKAEFGTARADRRLPFVQVPLKLSVKNTGSFSVYIVVDDFTVYGRTADYSEQGSFGVQDWRKSIDEYGEEEAERHVDRIRFAPLSSDRFYEPGVLLESGQEDAREHVFQLPVNTKYDLLHVDLQLTYMRKDRGRIDVAAFGQAHASWRKGVGQSYCRVAGCLGRLVYLGRVWHDNNLINVTRGARYVLATWSAKEGPRYSISPYFTTGKAADAAEEKKNLERFGVSTVQVRSEISVAELLKSIPSPRPS
ncbi:hypothetical protein [Streptomyces anandii]|uniref:hypothetical protein n=1 Tax=Streptomyces anandii TaxID=285454 RepID=UPI00379BE87A